MAGGEGYLGSVYYSVEAKFDQLEQQLREFEDRADHTLKIHLALADGEVQRLYEQIQAAMPPIKVTLDLSAAEAQMAALGGGMAAPVGMGSAGGMPGGSAGVMEIEAAASPIMFMPAGGAEAMGEAGEAEVAGGAGMAGSESVAVMAGGAAAGGRAMGGLRRAGGAMGRMGMFYLALRGFEESSKAMDDRSAEDERMESEGDNVANAKAELQMLKREKNSFWHLPAKLRNLGTEYIDAPINRMIDALGLPAGLKSGVGDNGTTDDEQIASLERNLKDAQRIEKRQKFIGQYSAEEDRLGLDGQGGGFMGRLKAQESELSSGEGPSAQYAKIDAELDKELAAIKHHADLLKKLGEEAGSSHLAAEQAATFTQEATDSASHAARMQRARIDSGIGISADELDLRRREIAGGPGRFAHELDDVKDVFRRRRSQLDPNGPRYQEEMGILDIEERNQAGPIKRREDLDTLRHVEMADQVDEARLMAEGRPNDARLLRIRHETEHEIQQARITNDPAAERTAGQLGIYRLQAAARQQADSETAAAVDPHFMAAGGRLGSDSASAGSFIEMLRREFHIGGTTAPDDPEGKSGHPHAMGAGGGKGKSGRAEVDIDPTTQEILRQIENNTRKNAAAFG